MLNNLKDLRKEIGLSQKVVAEKLNISQQTYSDYENDKTEPTMEVLIQMAQLFGVTVDELLGISESSATHTPLKSDTYSAEERKLIEKYRALNPACKKLINNTLDTLVTTSTAATEQKKKV